MKYKIFLVLLAIFIGIQLWSYFSKSGTNWRSCQKVRIFMNEKQVLDIMGPPDYKYEEPEYKNISFWGYDAGIGAAEGINLAINKEHNQVVDINCNGTMIHKTINGSDVPQNYLSHWKVDLKGNKK